MTGELFAGERTASMEKRYPGKNGEVVGST